MKTIINNETHYPDDQILPLVAEVIKGGLVSGNNDCYCYCSVYEHKDVRITVYAKRNSATSHSFTVVE